MSRRRLEARGGQLVLRLMEQELGILRSLVADVDAALDGPTDDDVVARLFPAVVQDDAVADDELRSLFAGDMLLERHEAMAEVGELLSTASPARRGWHEVVLDPAAAALLLGVLNDMRLAIAARIGEDVVLAPDDVRDAEVLAALDILDWLGGLQSALLQEL